MIIVSKTWTRAFFILRLVVLVFVLLLVFDFVGLKKTGELVWMPQIDYNSSNLNAYKKSDSVEVYYIIIISYLFAYTFIIEVLEWLFIRWYRRSRNIPSHKTDNYIIGIDRIGDILIFMGVVVFLFSLFKLEFKEVFTGLSIFAASISILFRDYATNFLNGMIFTFSNQISIDDHVKVGPHKGKVLDINMRNIQLLNDDDDVVYIPNNYVYANDFLNYTKREIKKTSVEFSLDYKLINSVGQIEDSIIDYIKEYHSYIKPDSFSLKIVEIEDKKVQFKFQYILKSPDRKLDREIRTTINRSIVDMVAKV